MQTERLRVGTGVTCPIIRIHPAIVAQAAATVAAMMPGRFFLGVGTGENLNEHIAGEHWPSADRRREMLAEAVYVIRELWQGENVDHEGAYYNVEDARMYTLPDQPPEIYVAAAGLQAAELAGEIGDGLIGTGPKPEIIERFEKHGGAGKPRFAQVTVCWANTEAAARKTAFEIWPTAALEGEMTAELPLPRHFEQASKMVTEDAVAKMVAVGPDPQRHIESIDKYVDAGFDHIYIHQVGADQEGFFRFYEREVLPRLRTEASAHGRSVA